MAEEARLVRLAGVDFHLARWPWPFAINRRTEIDRYFSEQQQANPALWNGKLLLLRDYVETDSRLYGTFFETDYASMIAGISWGEIGRDVKACFGVAALVSSDHAFIVGLMAPYTRNAGMLCFPSGSVGPEDVSGTSVDIESCIQRELTEETGLHAGEVDSEPGWIAVFAGPRLPLFKVMRSGQRAEALCRQIMENLANQEHPEFIDVMAVHGPDEIDDRVPNWMRLFFAHAWRSL